MELAPHLAHVVDAAPDLERLANVQLNMACASGTGPRIEGRPGESTSSTVGSARQPSPTVACSSARPPTEGRWRSDPRSSNWRTREQDVELVAEVVRELGARFTPKA